jgi:tRNA threonylcarbamoyladenosine biosynthesis protein TsaE
VAIKTYVTHSETETADVALFIGPSLLPGSVLLLTGDLGAGKTAFVRGLAAALGIDRDRVSSPTFTLMQEYRGGRLSLFHVDLYRLDNQREIDDLGLEEIAADGVLAIEWAEKLTDVPPQAIRISLVHTGDLERTITIDVPE